MRMDRCFWTIAITSAVLVFVSLFCLDGIADAHQPNAGEKELLEGILVEKTKDATKMRAKIKESEYAFRLLNILPFAKWPTELSKEQRKIKATSESRFEELQADKDAMPVKWLFTTTPAIQGKSIGADMYFRNPSKWAGRLPSEKVGWGMFHLNIYMVQEGLTVYQPSPSNVKIHFASPLWGRDKLFAEAEKHAIENQKGVWQLRGFGESLKKIASNIASN